MKIIYKENETEEIAKKFLQVVGREIDGNLASQISTTNSPQNKATFVCLTGNLGAGKTTLMQNVGKILGIEANIISPTFVLRRDYVLNKNNFKNLIHIDAYRLDSPEMINQILTKEEMENKKNLIIIEWGERLNKSIFDFIFEIKHISENEREIILL